MKPVPEHVPKPGKPRPFRVPTLADRTLRNGLRVIAVRRPTIPRVEARLRVPAGGVHDGGDGARARLLPETLLAGTEKRTAEDIARELQRLGASMHTRADSDDLIVAGGTLASNLSAWLELLAEVVTGPVFPAHEVHIARDRVAQEIIIQRSRPQAIAVEAMAGRLFGRHRYGRGLPKPDAVRRVGPKPIATFHAARVHPRGSTLVLVGDLQPERAIERVEDALGGWRGRPSAAGGPAPEPPPVGKPILVVDRPGSVQTNIRMSGPGIPRRHPDTYRLSLASTVVGGYFSSRLFRNVREDKGYTYGIGTFADHRRRASLVHLSTAVATEVTAPAFVEIRYELERMVALPVERDELDAARQYLAGVTLLQVQTQSGLASFVDSLTAAGLGIDYLKDLRSNLAAVTLDDVQEASRRFLAPRGLLVVMVGDASAIARRMEAFGPVEVVPAPRA